MFLQSAILYIVPSLEAEFHNNPLRLHKSTAIIHGFNPQSRQCCPWECSFLLRKREALRGYEPVKLRTQLPKVGHSMTVKYS